MDSPPVILIADDDENSRRSLEGALRDQGYELIFAENGQEALDLATVTQPDLLLLDVMMPDMDGFAVCRQLRDIPSLSDMPIILITALDDQQSRLNGLESGADDFLSKPFVRAELRARVRTITRLNRYRKLRDEHRRLEAAFYELERTYDATMQGWVRALELRDRETRGHTERVTDMTVALARAVGISSARMLHVQRGSLLHDIGKLGIPDAILLKQGPLTEEEWEIMRRHPVYAYQWLEPIPYLRPALEIPLSHHERWDGSGYPQRLQGSQIPLAARCFAVVDAWDAMLSPRPYKPPLEPDEVRRRLIQGRGSHFDPDIVTIFLNRCWNTALLLDAS